MLQSCYQHHIMNISRYTTNNHTTNIYVFMELLRKNHDMMQQHVLLHIANSDATNTSYIMELLSTNEELIQQLIPGSMSTHKCCNDLNFSSLNILGIIRAFSKNTELYILKKLYIPGHFGFTIKS